MFEGQPLKARPFPGKTRVIWVLGPRYNIYIYICIDIMCIIKIKISKTISYMHLSQIICFQSKNTPKPGGKS